MSEKEYELNNITEEEAVQELIKQRDKILSDFSKAYVAETGIMPSKLELVHKSQKKDEEIIEVFYFREKDNGN